MKLVNNNEMWYTILVRHFDLSDPAPSCIGLFDSIESAEEYLKEYIEADIKEYGGTVRNDGIFTIVEQEEDFHNDGDVCVAKYYYQIEDINF